VKVLAAIDDVAEVFDEGLAGGGLAPADFAREPGGFVRFAQAGHFRERFGRVHDLPGVSRRWGQGQDSLPVSERAIRS
jgi:hypothetical protein